MAYALAAEPRSPSCLILKGMALTELGRTDEAVEALRQATRLTPEDAEGWRHLALAFLSAGELGEAAEAFRVVLRLRPGNAPVLVDLGNVLLSLGRVDGGEASARGSVRREPAAVLGHAERGDLDQPPAGGERDGHRVVEYGTRDGGHLLARAGRRRDDIPVLEHGRGAHVRRDDEWQSVLLGRQPRGTARHGGEFPDGPTVEHQAIGGGGRSQVHDDQRG